MGIQDVIALLVVAGAIWFVARALLGTFRGRGGCGCGQAKSGQLFDKCTSKRSPTVKRRPIIPSDQIGLPNDSPK
jgi:hypothetical protein